MIDIEPTAFVYWVNILFTQSEWRNMIGKILEYQYK